MGFKPWSKQWWIERGLRRLLEDNMSQLMKVVTWLNAVPGRKRGVAAVLLGVAAALRTLGHTSLADSVAGANQIAQNYLVPGMDLGGFVMAVVGLWHAKVRS